MKETIFVDTREKPAAILLIMHYFKVSELNVVRSKLYVGDYMMQDNPHMVVDRKQNLSELCNNVTNDHRRFACELERARAAGIKVVILVEHGHQIKTLDDVKKWKNPRLKKNPKATTGETLYKILSTMIQVYDIRIEFCDKSETGRMIYEILKR